MMYPLKLNNHRKYLYFRRVIEVIIETSQNSLSFTKAGCYIYQYADL